MKKRIFYGRSDFLRQESPEISVKLGEGSRKSGTKCEVFVVSPFDGSPKHFINFPFLNGLNPHII